MQRSSDSHRPGRRPHLRSRWAASEAATFCTHAQRLPRVCLRLWGPSSPRCSMIYRVPSPLHFVILLVAGWLNRELQLAVDYLRAENEILREQLPPPRRWLTDAHRRRLAVPAKSLGRAKLASSVLSASPRLCSLGIADLSPRSTTFPSRARATCWSRGIGRPRNSAS